MNSLLQSYSKKKVLITGHTGFKGAWLSLWLKELGAEVIGYSLKPAFKPNLFEAMQLEKEMHHEIGDIRDDKHLESVIQRHQPSIVFHLAAQALVLPSFENPKENFETNVNGTLNLLEILRKGSSVQACVIITTDKCYRNREWEWGYRENDELGGNDPYSASKAMAELVAASYRSSFFSDPKKGTPLIATARAGNVIGGGDFSKQRILPDCLRALSEGKSIEVRSPDSVRPWLHVLDPLKGYLMLGEKLLQKEASFADAWNFGPREMSAVPVWKLVEQVIADFGSGCWKKVSLDGPKKEMGLLRLSFEKAFQRLNWTPSYDWKKAVFETVDWYQKYLQGEEMRAVSLQHLQTYLQVEDPSLCNLVS